MKICDVVFNARTGKQETREIERDGILTEAEARERHKRETDAAQRTQRRAELREQILEALVLGEDPTPLRKQYRDV